MQNNKRNDKKMNLKDELFDRLSSLKKKMKLIKKDEKELEEIFGEKMNSSIEDINEEIKKIEYLLRKKLDDKRKQYIENDIESLEVEVWKLEKIIKIKKITSILYKKYNMKCDIIELYEFINEIYNRCLKEEVRESLKKYIEEKKLKNHNNNELNTSLDYFSSPNISGFKKKVNKKLFFDIFTEINEKLFINEKEMLEKETKVRIRSKKEYLEKLMKLLFDEKILLEKLKEERLRAEIERKRELAEEIMAKKIKIKKIIDREALILKKLENLIITKTNSEELLEDLFKLKKIFKETERTRSPLSESVYNLEDIEMEEDLEIKENLEIYEYLEKEEDLEMYEDLEEVEEYEQISKTSQRQPVKTEVKTYDTIQILDQELKLKKISEEPERTRLPLSKSVCSFRNLENEENLEKSKVNRLEEKESDLYKSLSEATEEIKDSKALQR